VCVRERLEECGVVIRVHPDCSVVWVLLIDVECVFGPDSSLSAIVYRECDTFRLTLDRNI
jgi:hypothetical protein